MQIELHSSSFNLEITKQQLSLIINANQSLTDMVIKEIPTTTHLLVPRWLNLQNIRNWKTRNKRIPSPNNSWSFYLDVSTRKCQGSIRRVHFPKNNDIRFNSNYHFLQIKHQKGKRKKKIRSRNRNRNRSFQKYKAQKKAYKLKYNTLRTSPDIANLPNCGEIISWPTPQI